MPYEGKIVNQGYSRGPKFPINKLLSDIDTLMGAGRSRLDNWGGDFYQIQLSTDEKRAHLSSLLNRHYERIQLAYAEIVNHSFSNVSSEFAFYHMLPVRYIVEVVSREREGYTDHIVNWTWRPVANWPEAGASVSYPTELTDLRHLNSVNDVEPALSRLGRNIPPGYYASSGSRMLSTFGDTYGFGLPDETSVSADVGALIKTDVGNLFEDLPGIIL